jgi:hypothetical protein
MVLKCIDDYLAGVRYPLELLKHLPCPSAEIAQTVRDLRVLPSLEAPTSG